MNISSVIIGGDFNTDFKRSGSLHTKQIESTCIDYDYVPWLQCTENNVDYSYESAIDGSQSLIDHFLISRPLSDHVLKAEVMHRGDNLSDHSIVSITVAVNVEHVSKSNTPCQQRVLLWDRATEDNIACYKTLLDANLLEQNLLDLCVSCDNLHCTDSQHRENIDFVSSAIINCCIEAAEIAIPSKSDSGNKSAKRVPGWTENVEPLKKDTLFWHSIWLSCGSPRTGVVAGIRRRVRALYHRAVKRCKKEKDRYAAMKMAEAYMQKDQTDFWRAVKSKTKHKQSLPSSIDDVSGDKDIADMFADKYEELYNSACSSDVQLEEINDHLNDLIKSRCMQNNCRSNHTITVEQVAEGVKLLKSNKKDGCTGHNSNHIIFGTTLLYEILAKFLSAMLHHGYASPDFRQSVIIPIVKNKQKSVNKSTNYRGIALSSIIAKLMDVIIIKNERSVIQSTDFQFGFKEKSSTTQCTFVMNEVIQYYLNNGGTVYATFLDASKAFDSVKFEKLFRILIDREMCPLAARFLAFVYMNQSSCLKWGSSVSSSFSAQNGVKQGGALSPQLFNTYLDVLLTDLKKTGFGCHIGHKYMGSFAYADDIVLLSP